MGKEGKALSQFNHRIRELRKSLGLTQAQVAAALELAPSSYGNAENFAHKTMSEHRVKRLARMFRLDDAGSAELVALWREMPASEYAQRNAEKWSEQNSRRSKARMYDKLKISLVEMVSLCIGVAPDSDTLCICETAGDPDFGTGEPCELCTALELLELPRWTNRHEVIEQLAALQEKLQTAKS